MKNLVCGLGIYADTIAVTIADPDGEGRALGGIPNRVDAVRGLVNRVGSPEQFRIRIQPGPPGRDVLAAERARRALRGRGAHLRAGEAGDRVETDRRDAMKLV
jgi:transposase